MNEKGTKKQGNPINQVHHKLRLANTVNNDETETKAITSTNQNAK